jgi:hypothetical protein
MSKELWDYYAPGGTECVICKRKIHRPVNRNAHAEMHVRKGEAHRIRMYAPSWAERYYVGADPRLGHET